MRHGDLTREQVIDRLGRAAVEAVERENCEPTSRIQTDGDTDVEFSAGIHTEEDGLPVILSVYYYLTPEEAQYEDGADVDWQIHGYEIA